MLRLPILRLVTSLALLAAHQGLAASEADIERCRQTATAETRIACLEAALRAMSPEPAQPPVSDSNQVERLEPAPSNDLGAEQIATRSETEPPRVTAKVAEIRFVARDKLWVKLEDGQVWRQLDSDRTNLSRRVRGETELSVELWRSRFGGYRLALPSVDRSVKVRRLR